MAFSPTMRRAVRRVADILGDYARKQGWGSDEFRLLFSVNEDWGKIHVVFLARGFEGRDPHKRYAEVDQYLRKNLREEPELFQSIGLVIRTFKQLEEGGPYAIGPGYEEVKPKGQRGLLKRTVRLISGTLAKYGAEHNWSGDDYWIYYSIDPEFERVRFYFVAREFDTADIEQSRKDVEAYLEKALADEPEVLESYALRVGGKEKIDQEPIHRPGPEFKEYWTVARS
jgi:hypothetical protein